ncbi:MAG: hypothetical protein PWQ51_1986, partial [Methanolobus sp.]|nr:hypothetical protein [Methanolobus sp.]MDK2939821.1 hypothetical protein [Methanolobus sp.]
YSDAGTYYVEFNVTDSYGLPDSTIMEIVVSDVNYTPSHPVNFVNTTGNFWVLHEWMPATNGVLTDSYNVSYNGTWYNTSSTEFNTTDLIPHDWSNITVYAYNTTTSSLSSGIESSVQITNNPISITDIPSIYAVSESGIVTVDANFTDVDYTDVATFGCNRSDLFSDFNETDGTATWTTDHSDAGTYYVEFNVTDGYGLPDYTTMKIVVNNENRDPVFNHIGMQNVSEGDFVSFRVTANDEDTDDELTYSISGDPSGSTKSSNSEGMTFTWPTDYNDSGTYNITFRVDDEYGGNDTMVVPIVVANVNRAPTFDLLQPNYSINETDTLEINLGVNDQDKDSLTFWVNNTGNASGELNNDVYTWDTYYHDNGTYVIEFVVSDGTVNVSNTTTVYVNDVNAPPELTYIGSKTIAEEETLNFTVIATDEYDNDTLTYYTSNFSNNNATFNNETHLFSWTPISGEAGEYNITFYVTDGEDTVGEQVFITVTEASSSNEGSSSSSSSGGGGGGGSVSTGEEFENIFMKDYVLKSVIKDTETVFAFYKENNSIVSVSFTPKLNGGQVKAVVELLYGTSSQVSSDAPGDVYENMNIYVDTKLPSDAIGKSKVNFKVEKSWVNENGIDTSTITLCRYSNGWTKLPTEVKGEDDKYYYFIATTPGFSSFAISSVDPTLEVTEEASAEAIEENTQSAEAMMSTEDATQTELSTEPTQEGQSSIVPVIVLLGLIALTVVGIFGYRNRDYYEKVKLQLGNPDGKRYRRSKK